MKLHIKPKESIKNQQILESKMNCKLKEKEKENIIRKEKRQFGTDITFLINNLSMNNNNQIKNVKESIMKKESKLIKDFNSNSEKQDFVDNIVIEESLNNSNKFNSENELSDFKNKEESNEKQKIKKEIKRTLSKENNHSHYHSHHKAHCSLIKRNNKSNSKISKNSKIFLNDSNEYIK